MASQTKAAVGLNQRCGSSRSCCPPLSHRSNLPGPEAPIIGPPHGVLVGVPPTRRPASRVPVGSDTEPRVTFLPSCPTRTTDASRIVAHRAVSRLSEIGTRVTAPALPGVPATEGRGHGATREDARYPSEWSGTPVHRRARMNAGKSRQEDRQHRRTLICPKNAIGRQALPTRRLEWSQGLRIACEDDPARRSGTLRGSVTR
jgi:hypothetical protein